MAGVNSEHLKEAMRLCGESPKSQFGEKFDAETYLVGISDDLYEYDDSENPFSSDSESDSDEF